MAAVVARAHSPSTKAVMAAVSGIWLSLPCWVPGVRLGARTAAGPRERLTAADAGTDAGMVAEAEAEAGVEGRLGVRPAGAAHAWHRVVTQAAQG
jgi:hypothetical protein